MSPSSPILDEGVNVDPDNLPSGEEKRHQVRSLFDTIAPRYDLVNRIMSFGLDVRRRWRKKTATSPTPFLWIQRWPVVFATHR